MHTALGAFVAGMLIGQSPILTEHIEGELRGFIIAFFSPVFFAVAGLGMDLSTLLDPALLVLHARRHRCRQHRQVPGRARRRHAGRPDWRELLALATGLNARGSTEVIIASIGLSMGALSNQLYTMIVAMAVVTTMVMPPTLRWVLARVPLRDEESNGWRRRRPKQNESVPKMERALVYIDGSDNGGLAATLAGLFAARQGVLTTVLQAPGGQGDKSQGRDRLTAAGNAALQNMPEPSGKEPPAAPKPALEQLVQGRSAQADDAVGKEAAKGYSIAFVGIDQPISKTAPRFEDPLQALAAASTGRSPSC